MADAPQQPTESKHERRSRLLARRRAAGAGQRRAWDEAITGYVTTCMPSEPGTVVGLYWPLPGEFDTRALLEYLHAKGLCIALPAVVDDRSPLEFRVWRPDSAMRRQRYGIPVPEQRCRVTPHVLVVPLLGFDAAGYRLGYGGGYYDRTLAALGAPTQAIGVGYELSRQTTLDPEPHDRPMTRIVTEAGVFTPP